MRPRAPFQRAGRALPSVHEAPSNKASCWEGDRSPPRAHGLPGSRASPPANAASAEPVTRGRAEPEATGSRSNRFLVAAGLLNFALATYVQQGGLGPLSVALLTGAIGAATFAVLAPPPAPGGPVTTRAIATGLVLIELGMMIVFHSDRRSTCHLPHCRLQPSRRSHYSRCWRRSLPRDRGGAGGSSG